MPPPDGALEFLGLEGCAECVTRCGCIVRAYGDLICGAVGITIVVIAVLYVAFNTLDVLITAILLLLHFHFLFPPLRFCAKSILPLLLQCWAVMKQMQF